MEPPLPQPWLEAPPCAGEQSAADDAKMEVEEEVFQTQLPEYLGPALSSGSARRWYSAVRCCAARAAS